MYAAIDFQDGGGIMLLVKMSCEERCLSFHAGHFVCAEKKKVYRYIWRTSIQLPHNLLEFLVYLLFSDFV